MWALGKVGALDNKRTALSKNVYSFNSVSLNFPEPVPLSGLSSGSKEPGRGACTLLRRSLDGVREEGQSKKDGLLRRQVKGN